MQLTSLDSLDEQLKKLIDGGNFSITDDLAEKIKLKVKKIFRLGRSEEGLKEVQNLFSLIDSEQPLSIKDFVALSNTKIKLEALKAQVSLSSARQLTEDDITKMYKNFFLTAREVIDNNNIPRENILYEIRRLLNDNN